MGKIEGINWLSEINQYKNKYVRDLVFVALSPDLIASSEAPFGRYTGNLPFGQSTYLQLKRQLEKLDDHPEPLLTHLNNNQSFRLGIYFEQLVLFLLKMNLEIDHVESGIQLFEGKRTLGEIDFLYRNQITNSYTHLEVAVKYYLCVGKPGDSSQWIGPNSTDNLERKCDTLLNKQVRRFELPVAKAILQDRKIESIITQVLFKGWLFQKAGHFLSNKNSFPAIANRACNKGWWCYVDEFESIIEDPKSNWLMLGKMDWLAPILYDSKREVLGKADVYEKLSKQLALQNFPIMVAELNEEMEWKEKSRGFVAPRNWPGN